MPNTAAAVLVGSENIIIFNVDEVFFEMETKIKLIEKIRIFNENSSSAHCPGLVESCTNNRLAT